MLSFIHERVSLVIILFWCLFSPYFASASYPYGNLTKSDLELDASSSGLVSSFNICLWTSVALVITTYAICHALWNMDPGRDSIIYRLTATRPGPGLNDQPAAPAY